MKVKRESEVAQLCLTLRGKYTKKVLFTQITIGGGNGSPLLCSCLENPRDGGAWWAAVYGVAESDTTEVTWQLQQTKSS